MGLTLQVRKRPGARSLSPFIPFHSHCHYLEPIVFCRINGRHIKFATRSVSYRYANRVEGNVFTKGRIHVHMPALIDLNQRLLKATIRSLISEKFPSIRNKKALFFAFPRVFLFHALAITDSGKFGPLQTLLILGGPGFSGM
jgi:hypothetical protein